MFRGRAPEYEKKTFFAQLDHIYVVRIPQTPALDINNEETLILAEVRTCIPRYTNDLGMVYYEKVRSAEVVDMSCIQCLVGRIPIPREQGPQLWAVVDRSGGLSRAIYAEEEGNA